MDFWLQRLEGHQHPYSLHCSRINCTMAELSNCNSNCVSHKAWNTSYLVLYKKNLSLTPTVAIVDTLFTNLTGHLKHHIGKIFRCLYICVFLFCFHKILNLLLENKWNFFFCTESWWTGKDWVTLNIKGL